MKNQVKTVKTLRSQKNQNESFKRCPVCGSGNERCGRKDGLWLKELMVNKAWWAYLVPGGLIFRTGMSILKELSTQEKQEER